MKLTQEEQAFCELTSLAPEEFVAACGGPHQHTLLTHHRDKLRGAGYSIPELPSQFSEDDIKLLEGKMELEAWARSAILAHVTSVETARQQEIMDTVTQRIEAAATDAITRARAAIDDETLAAARTTFDQFKKDLDNAQERALRSLKDTGYQLQQECKEVADEVVKAVRGE